jgi:hypothetical protein
MMKVAYSRAEIESKDIIRDRQYRKQDSNQKTDRESGGNHNPWQKHGEQGPGSIHRACAIRRNGFQT